MSDDDYFLAQSFGQYQAFALGACREGTELHRSVHLAPLPDAMRYLSAQMGKYFERVSEGKTDVSERVVYGSVGDVLTLWDRIQHEDSRSRDLLLSIARSKRKDFENASELAKELELRV